MNNLNKYIASVPRSYGNFLHTSSMIFVQYL